MAKKKAADDVDTMAEAGAEDAAVATMEEPAAEAPATEEVSSPTGEPAPELPQVIVTVKGVEHEGYLVKEEAGAIVRLRDDRETEVFVKLSDTRTE